MDVPVFVVEAGAPIGFTAGVDAINCDKDTGWFPCDATGVGAAGIAAGVGASAGANVDAGVGTGELEAGVLPKLDNEIGWFWSAMMLLRDAVSTHVRVRSQ